MQKRIPNVKAIVTDIEGTTSSISFVHKILFPYAQQVLEDLKAAGLNQISEFAKHLAVEDSVLEKIFAQIEGEDCSAKLDYLLNCIEQDIKFPPLKELQGHIWQRGYEAEAYRGHVYEDAYKSMLEWHRAGLDLYVYSSGSIKAQKLLFKYSDFGDICFLFKDHFDTSSGPKKEAKSYKNIVKAIDKYKAEEILFLSDVEEELMAAAEAGLEVLKLVREMAPDAELPVSKFSQLQNFNQVTSVIVPESMV